MKKMNFVPSAAASLGIVLLAMGGCKYIGQVSRPEYLIPFAASFVTYTVVQAQKHTADQHDQEVAAKAAEKRKADLTKGEKTEIDKQNAKMAVVVGETADAQLVMIYDTKENRPVDSTVYTVKKSEIQKLESLSKVQEDAHSKGGSTGEWSNQPANAPAEPPSPTASDSPGGASGSSGAVNPNDVRFGELGGEKVIFRL